MLYENFNQEATEEYRTFSLSDRLVDLKKGQVNKIKFFQKDKIKFERKYVLPIPRQNSGQSIKRSANVVIVIKNTKDNGLGFPLPNGLFKVYGENQLFIGESYANPTPFGSEAKILIGSAFDIVYDVKNLSHRVENIKLDISEYEVKIRNSKTTEEEVIIEFPLIYYTNNYGYEMKSPDLKFDQISAQLLSAKTKIKPKEEKTFRFEITERMYY